MLPTKINRLSYDFYRKQKFYFAGHSWSDNFYQIYELSSNSFMASDILLNYIYKLCLKNDFSGV